MEKIIFSLLGPPGAGKGTLAHQIAISYGAHILSIGALYRKHIGLGSELGKQFAYHVQRGILIPDKLVTMLVVERIQPMIQKQVPIVLDGYPRTSGQAQQFFEFLRKQPLLYQFRVIVLEIDIKECAQRLQNRFICANEDCQKSFDRNSFDEPCSLCGQMLVRRNDDAHEIMYDRLKRYSQYRDALLAYYSHMRQPVNSLEVGTLVADQVFKRFQTII